MLSSSNCGAPAQHHKRRRGGGGDLILKLEYPSPTLSRKGGQTHAIRKLGCTAQYQLYINHLLHEGMYAPTEMTTPFTQERGACSTPHVGMPQPNTVEERGQTGSVSHQQWCRNIFCKGGLIVVWPRPPNFAKTVRGQRRLDTRHNNIMTRNSTTREYYFTEEMCVHGEIYGNLQRTYSSYSAKSKACKRF